MRRLAILGLGLALAALSLLFLPHSARAADMLIVSDIHFNPFADRTLVDRLATAGPQQWAGILSGETTRMSVYGADTDWKLFDSALAAMSAQPKPDAVLVPGDFLAHRFRSLFDASATDHSDAAYRAFVIKTMRFVALELEMHFPHTPILPALGNNDAICGDYELRPGGTFLAATADIASGMIGPTAGSAFRKSWRALGDYVVPTPGEKGQSIVVLNTNFFSPHYRNACGAPADGNPAIASLSWLHRVLADAVAAHRKVWLLYHIPPGVDAYATAQHASCPIAPVPMFAASDGAEFRRLMLRYRQAIIIAFAGHVHMDGFRLLRNDGKAFGLVMMNPALSPIFGQNPAFRRIRVTSDGAIADETVYDLANLRGASSGAAPRWQREMDFDTTWDLPRFDVPNLETLYRRLDRVAAARERWFDDYAVQGPARRDIDAANAAIYRCTAGHDQSAAFAHCSCEGTAR